MPVLYLVINWFSGEHFEQKHDCSLVQGRACQICAFLYQTGN